MVNPMDLNGKTILVTGASRGIGRATVIRLSELGARVIMIVRDEDRLKNTLSDLKGSEHAYYIFDLKNIDGIGELIKNIVDMHGKLDGFAHCAGVAMNYPLKMTTYEILHNIMLVNFYAFAELTRIYSNRKYNNGGSIVVMSSIAGKSGEKSQMAYAASKAAVDGAVKVMAKELAEKRIRVNSIVASLVNTDIYEEYLQGVSEKENLNTMSRQFMGIIEPVDIANAIAFLLSDASRFITGTGMVVDGGYLA